MAVISVGFVGWQLSTQDVQNPQYVGEPDGPLAYIDSQTSDPSGSQPDEELDDESDQAATPEVGGQLDPPIPAQLEQRRLLPDAEQAAQLANICAGTTAGIDGADLPTMATHNSIVVAESHNGGPWAVDPESELTREGVAPLVRCVEVTDGRAVHYCDDYTNDFTYSGLASLNVVRLIRTSDGVVLETVEGLNSVVDPCPDEVSTYDDNRDIVATAGLDRGVVRQTGAEFTAAVDPRDACRSDDSGVRQFEAETPPAIETVRWSSQGSLVATPEAWRPTTDRPTSIGLCLVVDFVLDAPSACTTEIFVVAKDAAQFRVGEWIWSGPGCDWGSQPPSPPVEWFRQVVGPAFGYPPA